MSFPRKTLDAITSGRSSSTNITIAAAVAPTQPDKVGYPIHAFLGLNLGLADTAEGLLLKNRKRGTRTRGDNLRIAERDDGMLLAKVPNAMKVMSAFLELGRHSPRWI